MSQNSPQYDTSKAMTVPPPWAPPEEGPAIFTTLTPEKTLRVINDAMPGADAKDRPIKLVNLVVHEATVGDAQTGEEIKARRTILVDDTGVGYAFVSEGIIQSLRLLLGLLDRQPPFDPPIKVKVVEKSTKRGFRVYRVTLA